MSIIQGRQRPAGLRNVLSGVSDPKGRRWRVIAVEGRGPRLNDFEILAPLSDGSVLHVEQWGDSWIDRSGSNGSAVDETVAITVEAYDGPALHTATDRTVLWRGQGTQRTANFRIVVKGYAPGWTPASASPAATLDVSDASVFTLEAHDPGSLFEFQTNARGYRYVASVDFGGGVTAAAVGADNGTPVAPVETYRRVKRHREALRFSNTAQENVQVRPQDFKVRQWLAFSADVTAQTVLAVVRRMVSTADSPLLAGPDGSAHRIWYPGSAEFDVGAATADLFRNGRDIAGLGAASLKTDEWHIVALRFSAPLAWRYVNAKDSAGLDARAQDVKALHLVPGAMSDADIQRWMGYAAHRYDLAHRLPFDHPYRWGPPGFETPGVQPTPLPSGIAFGRLTRSGAGGWPLPYGGAHVLAGTDAASFAVTEGMLVPAQDGLPSASYSLTVDGAALTVTTEANAYSVRSEAEARAAETHARGTDGLAIVWREGRFGTQSVSGCRVSAGQTLTIRAEKPRRSVFTKFVAEGQSSALCPGRLRVEGMRAHDDDQRSGIMAIQSCGQAYARDCEAHGDWIDPATDFYNVYHDRGGAFAVNADGEAILELCEVHNVNTCGSCSSQGGEARIRYNWVHGRFGDGFTFNAGSGSSGRRWLHDNLYRDSYGRVEYYSKPHNDVGQGRLVNSISDPANYSGSVVSLITVQRNIVWNSDENVTFEGAIRRGERGIYIEGSGGGYGQHSGVVSGNVAFGRLESGMVLLNPNNSEAVVAVDNTGCPLEDGGLTRLGGARTQDRNAVSDIAAGSSFRADILATAKDGFVEHSGAANLSTLFADPTRGTETEPHEIIAKLKPVAGGPLDLGDGETIGAITLDGALKPLVTVFPPGRPAPPTLALDGTQIDVGLPDDPVDLSGLSVIRRDVRIAPTNDITNGSEPNWTTYLAVGSGVNITADSPGDPNYARCRVVTDAGPGPWSLPSNSVTPPAQSIGWTPADATRVLHFDASATDSVAKSGSTVTGVANLVADGPNLLVGGAPQHGARLLNERPVFDCDYSAAFLAQGVSIPTEHTWAFVFAIDSVNDGSQSVYHVGDPNVARHELYSGGSSSFFGKTRLSGLAANSTPSSGLFGSGFWTGAPFAILVSQFSREAGTLSHYVNGTLLSTQLFALDEKDAADEPTLKSPAGQVGIWRDGSPGINQPDGAWAESILLGGTKVKERRRLEGWLAHKWGLTALLPADHPYRTITP